jgi:hypothetical protein
METKMPATPSRNRGPREAELSPRVAASPARASVATRKSEAHTQRRVAKTKGGKSVRASLMRVGKLAQSRTMMSSAT